MEMIAARRSAINIREAVLPWLIDYGSFEYIKPFRVTKAEIAEFLIIYRTPFSGKQPDYQPRSYDEVLFLQNNGPANLSYNLDIWHNRSKVLYVGWNDPNAPRVSFRRRGPWEGELIDLIAHAPPMQHREG